MDADASSGAAVCAHTAARVWVQKEAVRAHCPDCGYTETARENDLHALARLAQIGVVIANDRLHRKVFDRVYRYLRRRGRSPQDAEDIAQDTVMRIFTRLERFDPSRGRFERWMLWQMRACLTAHDRRKRREAPSIHPSREDDIEEAENELEAIEEHVDRSRLIASTLRIDARRLPPRLRELAELLLVEGLDADEISRRLGRNVKWDISRMYRQLASFARARLFRAH